MRKGKFSLKVSEELKKKKEVLKYLSKSQEFWSLKEILEIVGKFGKSGVSIGELSSILAMDENLLLREILFLERQGKVRMNERGRIIAL
ncbi:hypothetical protein DRN63_02195 [Nanoarchaeota archaeon]|nr:MAG: hypothetical protein DRN63_02195 [Nanoarchaeota archaeon]